MGCKWMILEVCVEWYKLIDMRVTLQPWWNFIVFLARTFSTWGMSYSCADNEQLAEWRFVCVVVKHLNSWPNAVRCFLKKELQLANNLKKKRGGSPALDHLALSSLLVFTIADGIVSSNPQRFSCSSDVVVIGWSDTFYRCHSEVCHIMAR